MNARCPTCGRLLRVRSDGTIGRHRDAPGAVLDDPWCPGSGTVSPTGHRRPSPPKLTHGEVFGRFDVEVGHLSDAHLLALRAEIAEEFRRRRKVQPRTPRT